VSAPGDATVHRDFRGPFARELAWIRARRGEAGSAPTEAAVAPSTRHGLVGLALSGGGIRSATFALGVLQALAAADRLRRVDLLSTVSGGGYLGTSLSWLLRTDTAGEAGFGMGPEDFPYGSRPPGEPESTRTASWTDHDWRDEPERGMLRFLREHGKYLTPGAGITLASGIAVVLRGVWLQFAVWLPVAAGLLCVAVLLAAALPGAGLPGVCGTLPCAGERPPDGADADAWRLMARPFDGLGLALLASLGGFAAACIAYSLLTVLRRGGRAHGWRSALAYRVRRGFERAAGAWLGGAAALLALVSLPWVHRVLGDAVAAAGGAGAVLLGALSGLPGFFRNGDAGRLPVGLVAPVGAALLGYGFLFLAYLLAFAAVSAPLRAFLPAPAHVLLALGLAVALLTGWLVNLNHTGLHRFYRDRLMETFLPPVTRLLDDAEDSGDLRLPSKGGWTGPSHEGDSFRLAELAAPGHRGPYHLLNTNAVMVDARTRRLRIRGGDSFVLSPLFCGGEATGWAETRHFAGGDLTLASAMAISGAAAHPNTGAGGVGPTRSKPVSLLMALLGVRLGYWAPNPAQGARRAPSPDHFRAALYELGGYREDRPYVQLSDGGHFENLGLYELVRRRAALIVVVDGGCDPDYRFADLQNAVRRILADFGARIRFLPGEHLEELIPGREVGYPPGALFARRGFVMGEIEYAARTDAARERGQLLLLKSTLVEEVGLRAKGYKGRHPDFPHQSTGDQFFDEEQFEAYRELGYRIGHAAGPALARALARLDGAPEPDRAAAS